MNDHRSAYFYIADLIEALSPRDTLDALTKDLSDIARMTAKARTLLRSKNLAQSDTHGIFTKLSERMDFKEYALTTVDALLRQSDLPSSLASRARALQARTLRVDAELQQTLLNCYLRISKRLADITPIRARRAITLADLAKQLQQASIDLSTLLHHVRIVSALNPLPVTNGDIEKARADLRHNRAEIAMTVTQLGTFTPTSAPDTNSQRIAAEAAILSIADTLDALEITYKQMEDLLGRCPANPPTVH